MAKGSKTPPVITSAQNAKVKLAASLSRGKRREETGLVLVEGERLIREAIGFGADFEFFLIDPGRVSAGLLQAIKETGAEVVFASERVVAKASDTKTSQGVVAVARARAERREVLETADWLVVCDRVQDPGNLGTILRVACAAGVDGVILTRGSVDPKNPKVIRSSAGAYFRVPILSGQNAEKLSRDLRERAFDIVVADVRGAQDVYAYDWRRKHALVVGNEGAGPDRALEPTASVRIPMPGGGESLNVGVSTGVLVYEALRRRLAGPDRPVL